MKINTEIIRALNPCKDRFENYLEHYKDFDATLSEFIALDKITYSDKIWVIKNVLSPKQKRVWAVYCAESVLHIFENKYPKDKRVSECIDATKLFIENKISRKELTEKRVAAYAASAAAYASAAASSAAAAASTYAAYDAVYAAYNAAYAAYNAAYNASSAAAAASTYAANAAVNAQADINLQLAVKASKISG